MEQVGVREIRQNLSVLLRRVRQGETATVTDHGVPVALLTPLHAASENPLTDLIAVGPVLPAARRDGALPRPLAAQPGRRTATDSLLAERSTDPR